MRKTVVVALVLLVTLALGGLGVAAAQSSNPVQGVITSATSVYAEPSDAGDAVGELAAGTMVDVLRSNDNQSWYEIDAADFSGYVPADSLALLESPLLGEQVWAASSSANVAIFSAPNLNSDLLSTMTYGDVATVIGSDGGEWSVVIAPDGTTGWALTSALEPLGDAFLAVVSMDSAEAAGVYVDSSIVSDLAGSVENGGTVYVVGDPDGELVPVMAPGGVEGWMLSSQLTVLPKSSVTAAVDSAVAGVYAEPELTADVLGQVDNGASAVFLESVDDFWMSVYAPGVGFGYVRKDNFGTPSVLGVTIYPTAIVRQGPNDSIYKVVTELPTGTQIVVKGLSANGEWYQVEVPTGSVLYPYNGFAGWMNRSLVSVDDSGLSVTE
ncbi:MAG TPA: SH3 domain-containing protein [Aggregatilinea sp.]|uniref:SH3 domain-containing protein n=1 Tax=Aggregatilinea sp. TaxID=2806333 RepID=UPI002CEFE57D|nr:SH3 domain-containing protein [Aggregatilinea sp.]HML21505.1 SH3 domain-containing protein [Aggregatilinea sp.]